LNICALIIPQLTQLNYVTLPFFFEDNLKKEAHASYKAAVEMVEHGKVDKVNGFIGCFQSTQLLPNSHFELNSLPCPLRNKTELFFSNWKKSWKLLKL